MPKPWISRCDNSLKWISRFNFNQFKCGGKSFLFCLPDTKRTWEEWRFSIDFACTWYTSKIESMMTSCRSFFLSVIPISWNLRLLHQWTMLILYLDHPFVREFGICFLWQQARSQDPSVICTEVNWIFGFCGRQVNIDLMDSLIRIRRYFDDVQPHKTISFLLIVRCAIQFHVIFRVWYSISCGQPHQWRDAGARVSNLNENCNAEIQLCSEIEKFFKWISDFCRHIRSIKLH